MRPLGRRGAVTCRKHGKGRLTHRPAAHFVIVPESAAAQRVVVAVLRRANTLYNVPLQHFFGALFGFCGIFHFWSLLPMTPIGSAARQCGACRGTLCPRVVDTPVSSCNRSATDYTPGSHRTRIQHTFPLMQQRSSLQFYIRHEPYDAEDHV